MPKAIRCRCVDLNDGTQANWSHEKKMSFFQDLFHIDVPRPLSRWTNGHNYDVVVAFPKPWQPAMKTSALPLFAGAVIPASTRNCLSKALASGLPPTKTTHPKHSSECKTENPDENSTYRSPSAEETQSKFLGRGSRNLAFHGYGLCMAEPCVHSARL